MFKRFKFFPRFGNNNIVTFYFIFFIYLFKLVIFPRDVTTLLPTIATLREKKKIQRQQPSRKHHCSHVVGEECESEILILERESTLPRGNLSMDTEMGKSWSNRSNIQIWSKTGQKREGFKCKYSSFWIASKIGDNLSDIFK